VIFTNARIVTPERVIERGTVATADRLIEAVDVYGSVFPGGHDLEGDLLLPGFVELHTDNMEKHAAPRPGVRWPALDAVLAHDAQIAAAGITTVFDAVGLGDIMDHSDRVANLAQLYEAIAAATRGGLTRADHFIHLRCEITYDGIVALVERLIDHRAVRLVSVMDHTPGQRQFVDRERLRHYYQRKYSLSDAAFDRFVAERLDIHERLAGRHRAAIVALARARGLALASHDDATPEHVAEALRDGMTIAEFPTTAEAARASHDAGLAVLVGGPNIVLGGSHSGNISARELARAGQADIVSSDYVPVSLLRAAFVLAADGIGIDLPAAVRMISLTPARAAGLNDRGAIAPGQRADLVRVHVTTDGLPVVREVWRGARRIA
jgi:alpha-D-ribose 1-methylphosphonate 5-triphosphate diphosphatase